MRMKKNIPYILALISIFTSCAKTELPHFGGENDPDAVVISPSVAVLSSKSNPLGDATAQTQFNEGDVITITDQSDSESYTYALTGGVWKPTDGKYLLWHSNPLDIIASYGEAANVTDQSDAAKIASADYISFSGQVSRPAGSNELSLVLERRKALVTVEIVSFGNQYSTGTHKVSDLKVNNVAPYICDADDNYTSDNNSGIVGYSYTVILPVTDTQLEVSYSVGTDSRKATIDPVSFEAGKSYTIKLRVGKDKIVISDITVSDWTVVDWTDVEAH